MGRRGNGTDDDVARWMIEGGTSGDPAAGPTRARIDEPVPDDAHARFEAAGDLLWEACRREPDVEAIDRILAQRPEPEIVVPAAMAHGLGPMLWRALGAAGARAALGERAGDLETADKVRRLEAAILLPRAVALAIGPLTGAGFEPLILKGPLLAQRYPEPWLRSMEDLDVYLPRRQHLSALRALEAAGWHVVRAGGFDRYDTVLRHPEVPTLALELHYGLEAWYKRTTAIDAAGLWRRRVPVDCMGSPAFGLPPAEELVALAQHAGKPFHSFSRLIWVADLVMVVADCAERGVEVDWEAVVDLARRGRCTGVVTTAMRMARRIGLCVPEELLGPVTPTWRADALARLEDPTWPLACSDEEIFHLRFALADSRLRRMGLLVGSRYIRSEVPFRRWATDVPVETISRCRRWYRSRSGGGRSPRASTGVPTAR